MKIKVLKQLQNELMRTDSIKALEKEPLTLKDKIFLFFGIKTYNLLGLKTLVYNVGNEEYFINEDGTKQRFYRIYLE